MNRRKKRPLRRARRTGEPMGLTPRQFEVLQYVQGYQRQKGYSPTMQELADHFSVSKVTIFEHLGALEKKGWLSRAKYRARSLRIDPGVTVPQPQGEPGIPLAGYIAAGRPIEAIADDSRVNLAEMFAAHGDTFVLRVRGDSMIEEHIADGDYVVVQPSPQPHDGQTVVALLDNGDATLKKFYREGKRVRLQPANASYPPIYADNVNVQGVVVGVIRRLKD